MHRLVFENAPRVPARENARMDVACFVGFVHQRPLVPIAPSIKRWLEETGWASGPQKRIDLDKPYPALFDVPLPIDSWETFDRYFAWDRRDGLAAPRVGTYLGAAIRSFFAQGGRSCHVVALPGVDGAEADRKERLARMNHLLPGFGEQFEASPLDRATWRGAAHVLGLPDASFLCLPDLAALCAVDPEPLSSTKSEPAGPETFVECSPLAYTAPDRAPALTEPAPRCDAVGYRAWASFVKRVDTLLSRYAREVQFVAGLPLPYAGAVPALDAMDLHAFLHAFELKGDAEPKALLPHLESPLLQIAYPWVKTAAGTLLPEGLESPDGVLAGVLAANALARGTFRNALGRPLAGVIDLQPVLPNRILSSTAPKSTAPSLALVDRLSLFGPTPSGFRLLSDVTTSPAQEHRQGGVHRLFSVLTRAARAAGAAVVFEPNSESTWRQLVGRIESLLKRLWELGALRGATAAEAFSVRCNETTMTQADIDAGRMVCEVEFSPTQAIERIRVLLTLSEDGDVSLQTGGAL